MKSGWKWLLWSMAGVALAVLGISTAGAAEVRNVTAEYAWPWGAEIRYEVAGTIPENEWLIIKATDRTRNLSYTALSCELSGDTGRNRGAHHVLWDMDKQGVEIQSTNVVFSVEYKVRHPYCVVNLSRGTNASSYAVTYMDAPPSGGFNTDEYKTTKLVLQRIETGRFMMGDGGAIKVTLTKPFYMGLFEVTQTQWELVMGSNPSYYKEAWGWGDGSKRPVECVSYNMIRGSSEGAKWPESNAVDANSFMGRLRAKTGLEFDLPTEAQWEYACRAGTTTKFSFGDSISMDVCGNYMWYEANSITNYMHYMRQTHDVGKKLPNPWGLYDMHGNVEEWSLDWYSDLGSAALSDPKGPSYGEYRIRRGGRYSWIAEFCRSANRGGYSPSTTYQGLGFRLAITLLPE